MALSVAQVLVDCPGIEDLLTYSVPDDVAIAVGDIVTVPLGKRFVSGLVMELTTSESNFPSSLRPIESCISTSILPPNYWELLQFTSDYYCTPLLQTVRVALPPKLLDQSDYRVKLKQESVPVPLSANGQRVFDFLSFYKKGVSRRYLLQKLPEIGTKGLKELQKKRPSGTLLRFTPKD